MILPLQITFRNMDSSDLVEGWIREEAAKLDIFYPRIMSCRVVVGRPNVRHKWGSLYHVRIDLSVPGAEFVVKEQPSLHSSIQHIDDGKNVKHLELKAPHKDLRQAIDDAFKAAGRRLQDYARRQRGDVKTHEPVPRGRVSKLFPAEGYGFLETPGGREIYFHRNSVLEGDFDGLKIGSVVSFTEEPGDQGPQASTVRAIRRRKPAQVETAAQV
ncbi:MAG TPA: HPF/RaiA family ribosome-associated protein [Terriglobia bacterium]|nr:HPF/RaiA family ribosome-associated protein [Terriglobia bacterium]